MSLSNAPPPFRRGPPVRLNELYGFDCNTCRIGKFFRGKGKHTLRLLFAGSHAQHVAKLGEAVWLPRKAVNDLLQPFDGIGPTSLLGGEGRVSQG